MASTLLKAAIYVASLALIVAVACAVNFYVFLYHYEALGSRQMTPQLSALFMMGLWGGLAAFPAVLLEVICSARLSIVRSALRLLAFGCAWPILFLLSKTLRYQYFASAVTVDLVWYLLIDLSLLLPLYWASTMKWDVLQSWFKR